jgi:hypothetical protein
MTTRSLLVRALPVCLVWAFFAGCSSNGDPVTPPPPSGPVSFKRDVQAIFNHSCATAGCHVQPSPGANCDLSPGVSYANIVNVPTAVYTPGVRVEPSNPDSSVLYLLVVKGLMPARGPRLTNTQLSTIKKWIEAGAPDN